MSGRIWIGLAFLLLGIGFFLHQLQVIDLSQWSTYWWPLMLIIVGVVQLLNRRQPSTISGILFLFIGLLFLLNQWFDLNVTAFIWPLILVAIGLTVIFTRAKREKRPHTDADLNTVTIFSGAEIKSQSPHFQGGNVTTVFGGAEIDLRRATFTKEASIEMTTIMGGAEITVPENVRVEIAGFPLFGGLEDKTKVHPDQEEVALLRIHCLTIFGGVEIKN